MNVVTWVEFPFLFRPSLWRLDEGPRCQTAGQRSPALSVWVPWGQVPWRQVSHQAGLTSGMLVTEHRSLSVFFRTGGCRSLPGYTTEAVDLHGDSPVSLHGYLSALTPGPSSTVPLSPVPCAHITCGLLLPPLPLQQASKSGDTFGGSEGPAIKRCNLVWVLCFDFA